MTDRRHVFRAGGQAASIGCLFVAFGSLCAVLAVAFAAGWAYAIANARADPLLRQLAAFGVFPFLATLVLAIGFLAPALGRRRRDPIALEVDADGIRARGMARALRWDEVKEVRLERVVEYHRATMPMRPRRGTRIGIVPRDAGLVAALGGGGIGAAIGQAHVDAGNVAAGTRPLQLAPFGVDEHDLDVPIERVADAIREFREVVEVGGLARL